MKLNWKKALPHIIAVLSFLILSSIYFNPQLQGESVRMGDIVQYKAMVNEVKTYQQETGEYSLWTTSMFGGMPTYQLGAPQKFNVSRYLEKISQVFIQRPIGYFLSGMILFYIAMILLGVNPWVSLIVAVAFGFTTNNLVLFEAGHTSKVRAIMSSSLIIAGTFMAYRKKLLLGAATFSVGLAINIYANHFQMTYYLGVLLGIYVIFELVKAIREKELKQFGIGSGVLLLCAILALSTSASKLLTTKEYAEDTMRGQPILEKQEREISSSAQVDGLEWNYAMGWSNSTIDLFSSFIPGVAGGGSAEPVSSNSNFAKALRGANIQQAPLYWGGLPSTSGPIYFGVVAFFLFILGLFVIKSNLRWWFLLAVLLTLLMSMGRYLEGFNRFLFDNLPLLNKFRTPNSVLSITAILIPFLAGLGVQALIEEKDKKSLIPKLYYAAGGLGVITLFFGLIGPSVFDFAGSNDALFGQNGYPVEALIQDRKALMRKDGMRSFLFILLSGGLIWAYLKDKLKQNYLIAGLGLLILFDLFPIGKRYFNSDDFVPARQIQQSYNPRPVDQAIMKDTDIHFRVHDITGDPFNSAMPSYFHKTIGGYHPAKLQRYQDLIEYHISQGNINVLNMLNTKYFIVNDEDGQAQFQANMNALGHAWFVDNIIIVKTNLEEINGLSGFDPSKTALINDDFQEYFNDWEVETGTNTSINLTSYAPNKLVYSVTGTGNKLAVFSEIWYGPDKGWQAYIDGEKVDHIRVNYALRALKVPPGSHEIIFEFDPKSYKTGERISLIGSIILLGLLGFLAYLLFFKKDEEEE